MPDTNNNFVCQGGDMVPYRDTWSRFANESRRTWGRGQTHEVFFAACSHVHNQALMARQFSPAALKSVVDGDTPGERQGLETTVEQALMRGLATA